MNTNLSNFEIDKTWIVETKEILESKKDYNFDLISKQIKKLPSLDVQKTLKSVEALYNELKDKNSYICNFFFSQLYNNLNGNKSNFALLPSNLKIQMASAEMAKVLNDPRLIVEFIKNFAISEKELLEIVNSVAQKEPFAIAEHINNFGIKNQEIFIEIAKSIVQTEPNAITLYIQNSGIKNQDGLTEIVKLMIQKNAKEVAKNIKNFGITDQDRLIEIAKIVVQREPILLSANIYKFEINDQEALIEIAKSIAHIQPFALAVNIQNFKLGDEDVFIEFAKIIAQKNYKALATYLINAKMDYTRIEFQKCLIEIFKDVCKTNFNGEFNRASSFEWFNKKLNNVPWGNPLKQMRLFEWMMKIMSTSGRTEAQRQLFIEQQPLMSQISKRDPQLRDSLTQIYCDLSSDQKKIKRLENFQRMKNSDSADTSNENNREKILIHIELSALLFASFPPNGDAAYERALEAIIPLREELRVADNQKLLVETLLKIKNSSLIDNKKLLLINLLFSMTGWQPSHFQLVRDLLALKAEEELVNFDSFGELKKILEKVFKKKFDVKINDFSAKYDKTIGTWRNKEALTTYASTLNELRGQENEEAHQYLKKIVQSILEGNFQKDRYAVDKNPHLKQIKKNNPTIFNNWQKGCQLDFSEIQSINQEDFSKNLHASMEIFKDKVKEAPNEWLDIYKIDLLKVKEELNALKPELELAIAKSESIKQNIEILNEELNNLRKELKNKKNKVIKDQIHEITAKILDQVSKKEWVLIQKLQTKEALLIALSDPKPENLTHLQRYLNKEIEFYKKNVQISAALKEFSKCIKPVKLRKTYEMTVIDTDDPNHFLLMGTEVLDSCQHVGGNPQLNKCLLGYFLDGKHRLCLVCDPSGKILARSVLRLLVDDKGQPVLFQERLYVADANPVYKQLIRRLALKKAHNLGIPLIISKRHYPEESGAVYAFDIYAKDKPVPFEYVDALQPAEQISSYTIPKDSIVQIL